MRFAWWLWLGLVACGDNEHPEPQHVTSGSRLRARWQVAGDARRLIGWHDATLDLDCDFGGYIANRDHRCVPPAMGVADGVFSDAACTRPMAVGEPLPYALHRPTDSCADAPRVFTPGSATMQVFELGSGSSGCHAVTETQPYFPLETELPVDMFAQAHESFDEPGQMWLVTEDGARVPWGGWDGTRAVEPTQTGGELRWGPWMVAYSSGAFSDATCTTQVADKEGDTARCPLDAVLVFPMGGSGVLGVSFDEIGDEIAPTWVLQDDACVPQPAGGVQAYAIGAPIESSSLADFTTTFVGTGPVQVRTGVLDGQLVLQTGPNVQFGGNGPPPPDQLIDRASGLPCAAQLGSDGATRCLPLVLGDDLYFLDAACTQLIAPDYTMTGSASLYAYYQGDGAVHARPVLDAVTPVPPSLYYEATVDADTLGACGMIPTDPTQAFVNLGAELPASRFAPVSIVVD